MAGAPASRWRRWSPLVDLSVRTDPTGTTWGNIFLLLLAAGVVGHNTTQTREATEARAAAERVAAALQERARLARAVHDGVLQVLALVQRRGAEVGGEAAELGRLAGEQEVALRALVQGTAAAGAVATRAAGAAGDDVDLASGAGPAGLVVGHRLGSGRGRCCCPRPTVEELVAVVRACLDNVARHVGAEAPAWVLVEDLGDRVVLSVRDEGPGIAAGRLEEARARGAARGERSRSAGRMRRPGRVGAPGGRPPGTGPSGSCRCRGAGVRPCRAGGSRWDREAAGAARAGSRAWWSGSTAGAGRRRRAATTPEPPRRATGR